MIEKNIRLQPHHSRDLLVGRRSDGRRPGYQPPGGGATSIGSGRDVGGGGGGGGHDRGGGQHAAQAAAAQQAARNRAAAEAAAAQQAAAQRAMQAPIAQAERAEVERQEAKRVSDFAEARRLMTQPTTVDVPIKGPELIPGTTGPVKLDPYQQNYISPGRVDIKDRYQTGDYADLDKAPIDVGFQNILRKQEIAKDLRQKQQDPDYGQFFRPQPVVEKPKSGIGGALKTAGKGILEMALMPFLPKPVRTAWSGYKRAKQLEGLAKRTGILDKDIVPTLNLSNLRSTIQKGADLRSRPSDMPEHLGERGFRTRDDTPPRDGEGGTIQQAITGETGLLTEGAETLGITTDQRKQYMLMQNKMKTALDQGSYTNEQGQVIQLNEQQLNQLQSYLDKLDNILQTTLQKDQMPMGAAHGGRIDGPLTGGSRYI